MQLSDHSLRQIDEAYLERLGEESLRSLSSKLLLDLKEARERLNQSSRNSSLPPSREAPWNKPSREDAATEGDENPEETVSEDAAAEAARDAEAEAVPAPAVDSQPMAQKRAGKMPGAPGYGRPAPDRVDAVEIHRPEACAGCGAGSAGQAGQAYTGYYEADWVREGNGWTVRIT